MHSDIVTALERAEQQRAGIEPLTENYPGLSQADAYAIQAGWLERKLAGGAQLVGRKVGLTSQAMQKQLNVHEPDFGFLLQSMLVPAGGTLKRGDLLRPRVEPES